MARSKTPDHEDMVPISTADMSRFLRCAPAALEHRGGSYAREELGKGANIMLTGLLPIVGMIFFDWSATQLVFFLLAGVWLAIVCDFAKLVFLREAVHRYAESRYDDWHVWVVAEAVRNGKHSAPRGHLNAKYQPGGGVVIDIIMGGVSTLVIWASLTSADARLTREILADRGVLFAFFGLAAVRVGTTIYEIVDHRLGAGRDRGVKIAVGLRGVGLFLLMFLMFATAVVAEQFTDDASDVEPVARMLMLVLNALIVMFGVFTAVGPWTLRGETAWLCDYLEREHGGSRSRRIESAAQ